MDGKLLVDQAFQPTASRIQILMSIRYEQLKPDLYLFGCLQLLQRFIKLDPLSLGSPI